MNNLARAQAAYDAMTPDDPDFIEVTEDHKEAAIETIKSDPGELMDFLGMSSFWAEHVMFLYDNSEQFRAEIERSQKVRDRAIRLAEAEYQSAADEAEFERAEMLREDWR